MKKVNEILGDDKVIQPKISQRFKNMCVNWAYKAHEIDNSRPIKYYYELFLDRAKNKYFREVFGQENAIEI